VIRFNEVNVILFHIANAILRKNRVSPLKGWI